jgi:hypothetical protein
LDFVTVPTVWYFLFFILTWRPTMHGYINNTMIKLTIYFNSHMSIDEQITNIIPKWLRRH